MLFRFSDVFYEQGVEHGIEKGREEGIFSTLFQLVNNHVITEAEGAKQTNKRWCRRRHNLKLEL